MNSIIKFSATWCKNCPTLSKVLYSIPLGFTTLVEVDIDQEPDMAKAYNIRMLPTLVLLNSTGEEIKRCSGVKSKDFLLQFLDINQREVFAPCVNEKEK